MSVFEPASRPWTGRMLSVLRIVAGLVFISYGSMKVFGFPASPQVPPFNPTSLTGVAGMLEVGGGTLILLGLLTRPVAFILSGEMAVAYFYGHFPLSLFPPVNNGTPAVLFCFLFLYMSFAGGGVWSLDALIGKGKWVSGNMDYWERVSGVPHHSMRERHLLAGTGRR